MIVIALTHATTAIISWLAAESYRHGQEYATAALIFIVGFFIVSVGTL